MDVVEYVEKEQQKLWQRVAKKYSTPQGLQKSLLYMQMETKYVNHLEDLICVCAFGYWYFVGQVLYNYKEAAPLIDMIVNYDLRNPQEENIEFYATEREYDNARETLGENFNANTVHNFTACHSVDSLMSHEFPIVVVDLPDPLNIKKGSPEYAYILNF